MGIRAARRKVRHVLPAVVILVTAAGMGIGGDSAAIIPSLGEVAVTVDLAITAAYSPLALATTGKKEDATSYAGIWDAERSVFCGPELLARYRAGVTWVRAARRARGLPRLAVDVSAPIVDVVQEDHDGVLVSGTISARSLSIGGRSRPRAGSAGGIGRAGSRRNPPTLIWPADRAWFVASDTHLDAPLGRLSHVDASRQALRPLRSDVTFSSPASSAG